MGEPEPEVPLSGDAWVHAAISAARDFDWQTLRGLVVPAGSPRMPDDLLNSIPGPRNFNVLHQLAFAGDEPGAESTLRALVAAGCRFDPTPRTKPTAPEGQRNKTAPELAVESGTSRY